MISERGRLRETQKYGVSESSSEQDGSESKAHITAKGKEGKVLRKKLAIALGLRPSSSTSTTSQSEGDDVQNVVEVFRKQVRKTVDSRSRNFPRIQERKLQENPDKSSLIIHKTVRKTTDVSGEFLEEDFEDFDDIDRQETVSQKRSKEQHSMTAEKFETSDYQERKSHDATGENSKHPMIRNTTKAESINEFLNEDINEEKRASRKTKKIQDNSKTREMAADKKSGKRLRHNTKMENEESEIVLKTESWNFKTRNAKQNESIIASKGEEYGHGLIPSEEIFSSYGEQSENTRAPSAEFDEVSTRESVKLLREKIRKNARARQVRRSSRVERNLEEKSHDIQNQENSVGESDSSVTSHNRDQVSSIPISIPKRKPSDSQSTDTKRTDNYKEVHKENMLDLKTRIVQKSKIPRRKSQNAKDEMGTHKARVKFDDDIEGQMDDAQSINGIQSIDNTSKMSKKISKNEEVERETFAQRNFWQKRDTSTNLSQLLRKVSRKTDSTKETITSVNSTNNNNITNKSQTSIISDATFVDSRHSTRSVRYFDFDSFEVELSKLKASVFKTYEEFKDIRSMAHGVEEELNDLKSTYGVSYLCMYGNN